MNWQKVAIEDLKKYRAQVESLDNIKLRVAALAEDQVSIKSSMSDKTPVKGGSSRIEDRMINNMAERERLSHNYTATSYLVKLVEKGLAGLDERQRLVLDRFYINSARGNVERLMEELGYEQAQIYRIKDDALYTFTIYMYGLLDY